MKKRCLSVLALCCVFSLLHQVSAQEILATKDLPEQKTLVLSRRPVPFTPPTEEQKRELEKRSPGSKYAGIAPTRVDEYSLKLHTPDKKEPEVLWQKIIKEYDANWYRPYRVFDFAYQNGVTIVVHKVHVNLLAEVSPPADPKDKSAFGTGQELLREVSSFNKVVTVAKISGSIAKDNLAITVELANGDTRRFMWMKQGDSYKWVEQKPETPPEAAPPEPQPDAPK